MNRGLVLLQFLCIVIDYSFCLPADPLKVTQQCRCQRGDENCKLSLFCEPNKNNKWIGLSAFGFGRFENTRNCSSEGYSSFVLDPMKDTCSKTFLTYHYILSSVSGKEGGGITNIFDRCSSSPDYFIVQYFCVPFKQDIIIGETCQRNIPNTQSVSIYSNKFPYNNISTHFPLCDYTLSTNASRLVVQTYDNRLYDNQTLALTHKNGTIIKQWQKPRNVDEMLGNDTIRVENSELRLHWNNKASKPVGLVWIVIEVSNDAEYITVLCDQSSLTTSSPIRNTLTTSTVETTRMSNTIHGPSSSTAEIWNSSYFTQSLPTLTKINITSASSDSVHMTRSSTISRSNFTHTINSLTSSTSNLIHTTKALPSKTNPLTSGTSNLIHTTKALTSETNSLTSGTSHLTYTTKALTSETNSLTSGTSNLTHSTKTFTFETNSLTSGTSTLTHTTKVLPSETNSLTSGTSNLTHMTKALTSETNSLTSGTSILTHTTKTLTSETNSLTSGKSNLTHTTKALTSGTNSLTSGTSNLTHSTKAFTFETNSLTSGTSNLTHTTKVLPSETNSLTSGTSNLTHMTKALTSETNSLTSGTSNLPHTTKALTSKTNSLTSGTPKLTHSTKAFTSETNSLTSGTSNLTHMTKAFTSATTSLTSGTSNLTHTTKALISATNSLTSGTSNLTHSTKALTSATSQITETTKSPTSDTSDITQTTKLLNYGVSNMAHQPEVTMNPNSNGKVNLGIIIGAVCAILLFLFILVLCLVIWCKKKKQTQKVNPTPSQPSNSRFKQAHDPRQNLGRTEDKDLNNKTNKISPATDTFSVLSKTLPPLPVGRYVNHVSNFNKNESSDEEENGKIRSRERYSTVIDDILRNHPKNTDENSWTGTDNSYAERKATVKDLVSYKHETFEMQSGKDANGDNGKKKKKRRKKKWLTKSKQNMAEALLDESTEPQDSNNLREGEESELSDF